MKMTAKRCISALGRGAISILNYLLPKQSKAVLAGFPDMEDSILELARQLAHRKSVAVIVLTEGDVPPFVRKPETGITWCGRKSLGGVWHYLTARYVFFTHGLYLSPKPPRSQICINVWHGMPIKRIGHLLGRTPPPATLQVATSNLFEGLVARCFNVPEEEVLTTGIPRNDVLVRAAQRPEAIKARIGLAAKDVVPRLIVWLPTYREAVRGIQRTDGRAHRSIFGMDVDIGAFTRLLEEQNCVCIIKPHPMAANFTDQTQSDRVMIWRESDLQVRGIRLYELVGATDLLITDASSVYVDYLIVDKPVIIAFPDLEEYRRSRGFALEPVEDYFAGPVVSNYPALRGAIIESFATDIYSAQRARVATAFHNHRDDRATVRLLDAVLAEQQPSLMNQNVRAELRPA